MRSLSISFVKRWKIWRRIAKTKCFSWKGRYLTYLLCYESTMVNVSYNTYLIDFGSTIHVSNTIQGLVNQRKPMEKWTKHLFRQPKAFTVTTRINKPFILLNDGLVLELETSFYSIRINKPSLSSDYVVSYICLWHWSKSDPESSSQAMNGIKSKL